MKVICSVTNIVVTNPLKPFSEMVAINAIHGNTADNTPNTEPMIMGFSLIINPSGHASRNAQIAAPLAPPADNHAVWAIRVRGSLEAKGM